MSASHSDVNIVPIAAKLCVWRVYGLAFDIPDSPKPRWTVETEAGLAPGDRVAVSVGDVPAELLDAVRDWRALSPFMLNALIGGLEAADTDSRIAQYRATVSVEDILGEYPLWLTTSLVRPISLQAHPSARFRWIREELDLSQLRAFGASAERYLDITFARTLSALERFQPSKLLFSDTRPYIIAEGKGALTIPSLTLTVADHGVLVKPAGGWAAFPATALASEIENLPVVTNQTFGANVHSAARWYSLALGEHEDLLRRFLFAFFGLEVLANKVATKGGASLCAKLTEELDGLPVRELMWPSTRDDDTPLRNLVFRFASMAIILSRHTAATDVQLFRQLARSRNEIAHGGSDNILKLPASEAVAMLQRYLALAAEAEKSSDLR